MLPAPTLVIKDSGTTDILIHQFSSHVLSHLMPCISYGVSLPDGQIIAATHSGSLLSAYVFPDAVLQHNLLSVLLSAILTARLPSLAPPSQCPMEVRSLSFTSTSPHYRLVSCPPPAQPNLNSKLATLKPSYMPPSVSRRRSGWLIGGIPTAYAIHDRRQHAEFHRVHHLLLPSLVSRISTRSTFL